MRSWFRNAFSTVLTFWGKPVLGRSVKHFFSSETGVKGGLKGKASNVAREGSGRVASHSKPRLVSTDDGRAAVGGGGSLCAHRTVISHHVDPNPSDAGKRERVR